MKQKNNRDTLQLIEITEIIYKRIKMDDMKQKTDRATLQLVEQMLSSGKKLVKGLNSDGQEGCRMEQLNHKLTQQEIEEQCQLLDEITESVQNVIHGFTLKN